MSELRATTISDTAGTGPVTLTSQEASKARINHTTQTTINEDFNISSLSDDGTGDYTVNFTNNFATSRFSSACVIDLGSASTPGYSTTSNDATGSNSGYYTRTNATSVGDKIDPGESAQHTYTGDLA